MDQAKEELQKKSLQKAFQAATTSSHLDTMTAPAPILDTATESGSLIQLSTRSENLDDVVKIKKFLAWCHEYFRSTSSSSAPRLDDLASLVNWFQKKWNSATLTFQFSANNYWSFFDKAEIKFIPTFNIFTIADLPDGSNYQAAIGLTKQYLATQPGSAKQFCAQLIQVIINRIYTTPEYADHATRQTTLNQLYAFINHLINNPDFAFLKNGYNFLPYLTNLRDCLAIGGGHNKDLAKSIEYDRTALKKWLEKFCKHALVLIENIPLYMHFLIQPTVIPQNIVAGDLLMFNDYMEIFNGIKQKYVTKTRMDKIIAILKEIEKVIKKEIHSIGKISNEQLQELVKRKKINLMQAGFYFDYVLNHPSETNICHSQKNAKPYMLSADQYLRELVYDTDYWVKSDAGAIKLLLGLYVKPSSWRSAEVERQEYGLALLSQHILRPDKLLRAATDISREHIELLSNKYLELTERMLNPQFIRFNQELEQQGHLVIWQPGIFQQAIAYFKREDQQSCYQQYFSWIMKIHNARIQISLLYWHVKELIDVLNRYGEIDTRVVYGEFLEKLAQHTINTPLYIIHQSLDALSQNNSSSVKKKFTAQLTEFFPLQPSLLGRLSEGQHHAETWRSNQTFITSQKFFIDINIALKQLFILCGNISHYTTEAAITGLMDSAEKQEEFFQQVTARILSKTMAGIEQYVNEARIFHKQQASCWMEQLRSRGIKHAEIKHVKKPSPPAKKEEKETQDKSSSVMYKPQYLLPTMIENMLNITSAESTAQLQLIGVLKPIEKQEVLLLFLPEAIEFVRAQSKAILPSHKEKYQLINEVLLETQKGFPVTHIVHPILIGIIDKIAILYSQDAKMAFNESSRTRIIEELVALEKLCRTELTAHKGDPSAIPHQTAVATRDFTVCPAYPSVTREDKQHLASSPLTLFSPCTLQDEQIHSKLTALRGSAGIFAITEQQFARYAQLAQKIQSDRSNIREANILALSIENFLRELNPTRRLRALEITRDQVLRLKNSLKLIQTLLQEDNIYLTQSFPVVMAVIAPAISDLEDYAIGLKAGKKPQLAIAGLIKMLSNLHKNYLNADKVIKIHSIYHLQEERGEFIRQVIHTLYHRICAERHLIPEAENSVYIRHLLRKIFTSFITDCSQHPKRQMHLQITHTAKLQKYFNMNVVPTSHPRSKLNSYILKSLNEPSTVNESTALHILFALNRMQKIDLIISTLPKGKTLEEEFNIGYDKFKAEVAFILNTLDLDEIPPILTPLKIS